MTDDLVREIALVLSARAREPLTTDSAKDDARAILAMLKDLGLKVVERTPTKAMKTAASAAVPSRYTTGEKWVRASLKHERRFNAMWDAAPWVPGEK